MVYMTRISIPEREDVLVAKDTRLFLSLSLPRFLFAVERLEDKQSPVWLLVRACCWRLKGAVVYLARSIIAFFS